MKSEDEQPQIHLAQYSADMPVEIDIPIDADPHTLPLAHGGIDRTKLPLTHFAWPLIIENVIRAAITGADVFMLGYYSEKAVAATGLTFQLVFFMVLLYTMVGSGASILISQYLGARDTAAAGRVSQGSMVLTVIFSVLLSAGLCLSLDTVVGMFKLEPEVHGYAVQYMMIYGAGSITVAMCIILSTIIRSYGHSRAPMIVNVIAMFINVVGNYVLIFGKFGAPALGVRGAAISTIASHVIACVILSVMLKKYRDIKLERGGTRKVPLSVYKGILAVGVPTAGENVSYNIGQILIMRFIASLGTEAMSAMVYTMTVLRFVFITSISIGQATQIKVGYYVGAKMADVAQRKVYRYWLTGVGITLGLVLTVKILQAPILNFLTENRDIHMLAFGILTISLVYEPGRNFNTIIIPALKGAGDVRFPVYMGMVFMWGVGVTLAYVFGIALGWGLLGIIIAMALDEWSRGIVMFFRWRGGRWKTKSLVK